MRRAYCSVFLAVWICSLIFGVELLSVHPSRFRRREFVHEEVRKSMLNYMTSLKGEITDVVLEEMVERYSRQTSTLHRLENESGLVAEFIRRLSTQQQTFAANMSMMEWKLRNLTGVLHDVLSELQQQRPIRHVRRILSAKKNDLPIGNYFVNADGLSHSPLQ